MVVGLGAPVVFEGSPCTGSGEQRSRLHVQGRNPARQVEAQSHSGGADLCMVQEGRG